MYLKSIKIGNLELDNNVFLAPMAGITDKSFRILCTQKDTPQLPGSSRIYISWLKPARKSLCWRTLYLYPWLHGYGNVHNQSHPIGRNSLFHSLPEWRSCTYLSELCRLEMVQDTRKFISERRYLLLPASYFLSAV